MSILEKLGINSEMVYKNLYQDDDYLKFLVWKKHTWPTYSQMLEALMLECIDHEKCGLLPEHDKNTKIMVNSIENTTGLSWEEISKRLKD